MSITQEKIALAIIKGHINGLPETDQHIVDSCANTLRELMEHYNYSSIPGEGVQYGSLALALVSAEYAAEGVEGE